MAVEEWHRCLLQTLSYLSFKTAADLENLGKEVIKKVYADSGIKLEWEIMRVGEPLTE